MFSAEEVRLHPLRKISVLLSYVFKALILTSHLILLPISDGLRAGGAFLSLQLMELCDTAEFSNFPVTTQPAVMAPG